LYSFFSTEFLKTSDTLHFLFDILESTEQMFHMKLIELDEAFFDELAKFVCTENSVQPSLNSSSFRFRTSESRREYLNNVTVFDLLVHFLLALNKKFNMPEDNILICLMLNGQHEQHRDHKLFSEALINLFNYESKKSLIYCIYSLLIRFLVHLKLISFELIKSFSFFLH
jgi:hypothetical protein